MKKFITVLSTCISVSFVGSVVYAKDEFANVNGIEIDNTLYEKLKNVGYSEDEFYELDYEKINKIRNMNIINYYYIENSLTSTQPSFTELETCSDYSSTCSEGDKKLETYITTYKDNSDIKAFVRQKVIWSNVPSKRYSDILTISYLDNMSLETINGNANVSMTISYKLTKYSKTGWKHKNPKYKERTSVLNKSENHSGENHDMYNHALGKYFAFKFNLPNDTYTNGSSSRYYMIYKNTYSDFNITMESNFISNYSDLIGTSFQSHYVHQVGDGNIDWGKITFTSTALYLTYQTSIWANDPSFDSLLFNDFSVRF